MSGKSKRRSSRLVLRAADQQYRLENLESRVLLAALSSTVPYNGQQLVGVTSNLSVTFASAMDASTLTASNIILTDPNGNTIASTLSYNATTRVLTIDPTPTLPTTSNYLALRIIGGASGVKGSDASALAADYVTRFTTGTPSFSETTAFSGVINPTAIEFAPDGRIFIAEKRGIIKVFDNLADTTPDIFADLRTSVHNFWDRGLLGMILDPQFTTGRPYVYALYSYDGDIGGAAPKWGAVNGDDDPGANDGSTTVSGRLTRLTANGNAMVGNELVLVHDWQAQFPSHVIGDLQFGPDGYLHASAGDGASFNGVDYGQFGNPFNDPVNQGGAD